MVSCAQCTRRRSPRPARHDRIPAVLPLPGVQSWLNGLLLVSSTSMLKPSFGEQLRANRAFNLPAAARRAGGGAAARQPGQEAEEPAVTPPRSGRIHGKTIYPAGRPVAVAITRRTWHGAGDRRRYRYGLAGTVPASTATAGLASAVTLLVLASRAGAAASGDHRKPLVHSELTRPAAGEAPWIGTWFRR